MLTDEQIIESWNKINKRLGLPPIVKLLPSKSYDNEQLIEAAVATEISPDSRRD